MQEGVYVYRKEVDWSLLHQGLTIPISVQVIFKQLIKHKLPRGTSEAIKIIFDNVEYQARLINQKFDEKKYPKHGDIVQIRYEPQSEIAKKLRQRFSSLYQFMIKEREQDEDTTYRKKPVKIIEDNKEYVVLYTTSFEDTFLLDYITSVEKSAINKSVTTMTEEEFEFNTNYHNQIDLSASIREKKQLVKIRKLDRSICDNLKLLYDHHCQITGEKFSKEYNSEVAEAHHIDYFTKSLNNNSDNIIIVSPNYHRLIHKLNPVFDRKEIAFVFPNGLKEKILLNKHL